MANINRDYIVRVDVRTGKVTTPKIKFKNVDKSTSNIYVQLVIKETPYKLPVLVEEVENLAVLATIVKPNKAYKTVHAVLVDTIGGRLFELNLPDDCINLSGTCKVELTITGVLDGSDGEIEKTTADVFTYTVENSLQNELDPSIQDSEDLPVLKQLIEDMESVGGYKPKINVNGSIIDSVQGVVKIPDYDTKSVTQAAIKELEDARVDVDGTTYTKLGDRLNKVDSQIKDKAAIGEVRENTNIRPINHTEFDTETKQLFTGGAVAVVGEKAVGQENLKDYAVTSSKRTTTGSSVKICSLSTIPIMLDINNKTLILPESDYNLIYYNNKFDNLGSQLTIDVSGNGTTCSLYYDTLAKSFKVFENDELNENCILIGTVYWNNVTGEYMNSNLNMEYVLKNGNEQNSKILGKIDSNSICPEGKSVRIYSQNPLNIDLVNKKLKIDKTGYCKVLVNGYLENVNEEEIDISIDSHHVSILYNKENNTLFSSVLQHGESDITKNNYLLGVIDIEKPYKSTIQCNFTVNGISYDLVNRQWYNKKIGCLGDSVTFGAGGTSWVTRLPELTGCKEVINYGISGTTIETNGTGKSFVERYSSMADDLDLICVWGGVNDHHWTGTAGRPFGSINSPITETNSFYGALKKLCEGLLNKYPSKKIMFITPMKNKGYLAGEKLCYAWNEPNEIGKTLTDYRNAILEVCDFYSIPVLDLYSCSGISPENETQVQQLMPDRLHPNTKGNLEILAPKIASFMNNL